MYANEKDLALCGLACVLCSEMSCPGCKARGCKEAGSCSVYQCATGKKLDGCYECADFPCGEGMLQGVRNRAFNRYARQYGKPALLDRLRMNEAGGISYHRPGGLKGDYDALESEEDIMRLIAFGTHDPYKRCPRLETKHYTLRLVEMEDAQSLLGCYADPKAQALFNADKCTSDFRYYTLGEMQDCVRMFIDCYQHGYFTRFAIVEREGGIARGTIEMFRAEDALPDGRSWGVLRIDLASAHETDGALMELVRECTAAFPLLFGVRCIITKAPPEATARIAALEACGYAPFDWQEPGREHYWLLDTQA